MAENDDNKKVEGLQKNFEGIILFVSSAYIVLNTPIRKL